IGAVIGHEISHSFDNLGADFDAEGRLANWWSKADAEHFEAAGQKLVEQYDAYEPLPGLHINGEQTLGENIADLAGLEVAHDAYVASLGGKPAPVMEGLSGDQRFFLAYAQAWRSKTRDEALRAQVIGDGHSPGRYRAQTVRNIDAWYDAVEVQPGQDLYLAPGQRLRSWKRPLRLALVGGRARQRSRMPADPSGKTAVRIALLAFFIAFTGPVPAAEPAKSA